MKRLLILGLIVGTAGLLLFPAQPSVSDEADDIAFVGAAKCKMCHNKSSSGKFYDDWEAGPHAKAFEVLKDDEKKDPKCLKCHTTGYGMKDGFVSLEETEKMAGVQCEMCHGPGEKHIKSKKDNVIPHVWKPVEETCKKCHNEENPNWDPNRYTDADGNKTGFDYKQAVKKINHGAVFEAIGKKPPMTGDL
ncbi:MAG: hypothetical protein GC154_06795 [bacterium]|nr:hypothetical protein [bacterium]